MTWQFFDAHIMKRGFLLDPQPSNAKIEYDNQLRADVASLVSSLKRPGAEINPQLDQEIRKEYLNELNDKIDTFVSNINRQGAALNPHKSHTRRIFNPEWLQDNLESSGASVPRRETNPSGNNPDAPTGNYVPSKTARIPSGNTPDASPGNGAPLHTAPPSPEINPAENARPGSWEERKARCLDTVFHVDRTIAIKASEAYLGGNTFLAGYVDEVSPLRHSEGIVGDNSDFVDPKDDKASTDSKDGSSSNQIRVPREFRITSRRVYGRILSIQGLTGSNEANMPSAPFAIIGAAVNIPKIKAPEGSNASATIIIAAPFANLGRRPERDGGLAQPLTDIAVGQCVVGTIEALDARESHA